MATQMKTIISASRRTDLPACHYDWLQKVLAAGQVTLANPRFTDVKYTVDLCPDNVHSIVLWSKDFRKVLAAPGYLADYNLYFQYTINNYNRVLEPQAPAYGESMRTLAGMLRRYRPEQFNIRFDPVIISTRGELLPTPSEPARARLDAFRQLCRDLDSLGMRGCRLTTSYVALYPHVERRLSKLDLDLIRLTEREQQALLAAMAEIAQSYGLTLVSCASPQLAAVPGIEAGRCIDGYLLEKLFGGKVTKARDSGQRNACRCTRSRDIGAYDRTCGLGCQYCYATK